jgi:DNA-binding transcriptional LysR family regulator
MTGPDLESLRLLVLVSERGSIGRAAQALGISQPAASKRLSTVERRLGLVLVDRTRRGSVLTPQGRAVAGWAYRVLTELDQLLTGAQALRSHQDAELRVAASQTVAEYLVPGWLGQLRQTRPGLYIGLQVTNSERVVELVRQDDVGLGFIESPAAPTDLSSCRVGTDHLVIVTCPAPARAGGRRPSTPGPLTRAPLTPAQLAALPLVVREPGSGTRQTLDAALRRLGCEPAQPLLELGSTAAVRSAVIAGVGPAVISELAVAADLATGRLERLSVAGLDLRRALRAVWPSGRRLVGPAAVLLALAGRPDQR